MATANLKRISFRLLTLAVLVFSGFVVLEGVARWQDRRIRESEHLDPGMIQPDARLGWRLRPNWSGRHQHYDFDVKYSINSQGFRHDPAQPHGRRGKVIAVVGDSFTFGLGVNDDETFTSRLNALGTNTYVNLGIPGFSTDQELLLIEEELPRLKPDELWLIVYVGNDLLDNQFGRPIQFSGTKPRFTLGTNGLEFHPPDSASSVSEAGSLDLATVVLGRQTSEGGMLDHMVDRSIILRRIRSKTVDMQSHGPEFESRFRNAIELFAALLAKIQQTCEANGVRLSVAVLPGRSVIEDPGSLSAQYQAYFVGQVLEVCERRPIHVWNLEQNLASRFKTSDLKYFHANDGHLKSSGHAEIGDLILCAPLAPDSAPEHRSSGSDERR